MEVQAGCSGIRGHWPAAGRPLANHWLAAGHWPTSGRRLADPLAAHWPPTGRDMHAPCIRHKTRFCEDTANTALSAAVQILKSTSGAPAPVPEVPC